MRKLFFKMKWSTVQIMKFLDVYEKYELLWDITHSQHKNRNKRNRAFNRLVLELKGIEGFENTDLDMVKTKIKTLKTVYRQELNKIWKSKKSGCGPDNLYKPKLMWFAKANAFLKNGTIKRNTTNNVTDLKTQQIESEQELVDESHVEAETPRETKPKKKKYYQAVISSNIDTAIPEEKTEADDEYDIFARHIASQLRKLPLRSYLILQGQIQQLISEERLNNLSPAPGNRTQQLTNQNQDIIQFYHVNTLRDHNSPPSTSSSVE